VKKNGVSTTFVIASVKCCRRNRNRKNAMLKKPNVYMNMNRRNAMSRKPDAYRRNRNRKNAMPRKPDAYRIWKKVHLELHCIDQWVLRLDSVLIDQWVLRLDSVLIDQWVL
jgi:hypothetical protein